MKDIGAVLKNARENKEFTQKQVMELTGINKKSLSGYENNVAEPDLQTFATLINLYGLSADEVLEISTSTPSLLLSKKESSLLSTFNKLDFQHQEETLLLLRTFQIVWTVFLFRSKCGHRITLGSLPGRNQSAK